MARLSQHTYVPDRSLPPARRGDPPLCRCGLPRRHERHPTGDQTTQTSQQQQAFDARRLGERERSNTP